MAEDKAKTGLAAGAGAALGAALGLLLGRKAEAAPPEGEIRLDEAAMLLLQSIAQSGIATTGLLEKIAASLGVTALENPPEITAFRVLVPVVNTPVQLPDRAIPYGKELVIKALPTNLGLIYVANSRHEAININSCYYIIANEAIEYEIKNCDQLWINATRAGEGVLCTAEYIGRGPSA